MFSKKILVSFCFVFSFSALAQVSQSEESGNVYRPEYSQSNFDEFSPVFDEFLQQARQAISEKKFTLARESLAPFLQQQRLRLGFFSKSYVELVLKNHTAEQTDRVQQEMIGSLRLETSLSYVSSDAKETLVRAIQSSLPSEKYLDSILKFKRTLLLSLFASLGEYDSFAGQDKKFVARQISGDFSFLIAPALRFHTASPDINLVIFEQEINPSREQLIFENELAELIRTYWDYFEFVRSEKTASTDFEAYRTRKQNFVRRSLMIKSNRQPASEDQFEAMGDLPVTSERAPAVRPTAEVSASALGSLQFDLSSLYEIQSSNEPVEIQAQQLKDYLLSSTMIWGQRRIEYNSSFTHSNSQIKVLVKNFPLDEKFISASVQYYLQDLTVFFQYAKEALIRSNSLSARDLVYNCLVRQSLAPQTADCDKVLASTSVYDENVRRGLANSYMCLLRYSRITFEHSEPLNYAYEIQTTCDQLAQLQKELMNSYRSTVNSYLPSLINLQGPAFKNLATGQKEFLCHLSLNPLLQ
jgi:hypothetical protein